MLLVFILLPHAQFLNAEDLTSSSFIVRDPVIVSSGGNSTSSSFNFLSNIGQIIVGESTSNNFTYQAGSLFFGSSSSSSESNTPQEPSSSGSTAFIAALNTSAIYPAILEIFQGILQLFQGNQGQDLLAQNGGISNTQVPTLAAPEILSYTTTVRNGEALVIKGRVARPDHKVKVFVSEEHKDELVVKDVIPDADGYFTFSYTFEKPQSKGTAAVLDVFVRGDKIEAWAIAFDTEGNISSATKKISASVDEPLFSIALGWGILFMGALLVIISLLGFIVYLLATRRRKGT